MNLAQQYFEQVQAQLRAITETQGEAIDQAGEWLAESLAGENWIYLFGTGHSHMLAEELFYRAGGLARIIPMLHEPLMLHVSASQSTAHERNPDWVPVLFERYPMEQGDVLLVISNSGRNPVPIELAGQAREREIRVIALVNVRQATQCASRHASGRNLTEVADLVLDNCGIPGDACVPVEALGTAVGPVSTITGSVILQMIVCATVEKAMARGYHPEMFRSSNIDGTDHNQAILNRYVGRVAHL